MKQTPPFQSVVSVLLDAHKPFPKKYLTLFSDIDPASLSLLMDAWPRISSARKRTLLSDLEFLLAEDTIVSFEDFARALLDDPDSTVRAGAIRLLAECTDSKLIPVYETILASDPDLATRAEAANILALFVDLGELEEIPASALHRAEEALLASLRGDENPAVKRRALEALGYSSRTDVVKQIEDAYKREDPEWVASALTAMGRSSDERWEEQVLSMLLSENDKVRLAAVKAAGELNLASARLPLLRLLDEEDDQAVFTAAVWSLSEIGGEDVREYLLSLADQTDDDDELDYYEEALANLAFTEDLASLELMTLDPDDELFELDDEDEDDSR
jgi:HEAT repeat protein